MKTLYPLVLIAYLCFSCTTSKENDILTYTELNGERLPVIHFENIAGEPIETGVSEIVSDYEIILPETKEECLIGSVQEMAFYDDRLLLSTQVSFPGPAPVYMFTRDGRFVREVGKGGNGPGEHTGYVVLSIETGEVIKINFMDKVQLFSLEGEYMGEVREPMEMMSDSYLYGDDIYFSDGNISGYPFYPRDSVMMVFHDAGGRIIKQIPRPEYPPQGGEGYTPNDWGPSVYRYKGEWNYYTASVDTLYAIRNMILIPRLVMDIGDTGQEYNRIVDPKSLLGKYTYHIVAENDNYWLFRNARVTVADVSEYQPGRWGGSFDMSREFAIVNKKGGAAQKMVLKDDIWELSEDRMINDFSEVLDNDKLIYSLQSSQIKIKIAEKLKDDSIDPEVRARLMDLDEKITENSNPVIFVYTLKDKFMIN